MPRDEALVAYLVEYGDRARLVLRDVPDRDTALAALRQAAEAVWRIPHPDEPDAGLPNLCEASLVDGLPVLWMDVKDGGPFAERIAAAILAALDAAGVGSRLEPLPEPAPPYPYDAQADILESADYLWQLGAHGLPPGFPEDFPVPSGGTLVLAEQAREGDWEHAAWRWTDGRPPFDSYPKRLAAFGCELAEVPERTDPERGGMHGLTFTHPHGTGAVWFHHEELRYARRRGRGEPATWFLSVVWRPGGQTPPPAPIRLRIPPEPATGEGRALPDLAFTDRGLRYEPRTRALLEGLVEPDPLVGYEVSLAIVYAGRGLPACRSGLPVRLAGDDWLVPLAPLRRHRAGLPEAELLETLAGQFRPEDPAPFLERLERTGELARSPSPAGDGTAWVQLTEAGHRAMDALLRRAASQLAGPLDGLPAERLALLRHACLRVAAPDQFGGSQPAEDGLHYQPGLRAYLGALAPHEVLHLEVSQALAAAARAALPPRLRMDARAQLLLWLRQELPLDQLLASLGRDELLQWLEEGERAGAFTRSGGPTGDSTGAVQLTALGQQMVDRYLADLAREMAARFDGIDVERLALVRDTCWQIAESARAAGTGATAT